MRPVATIETQPLVDHLNCEVNLVGWGTVAPLPRGVALECATHSKVLFDIDLNRRN